MTRLARTIIPDDWDGEAWTCVKIDWPDSPHWIAVLRGLIVSMRKGRTWDEQTGVVTYAQYVGALIEAANMPLRLCGDCEGDSQPEQVTRYIGGADGGADWEYSEMPVTRICEIDVNGVEVPDGNPLGQTVAGFRWFMGECCYHDILFPGVSGADYEMPGVELPDEITNGTACAKALKLAQTTQGILNASFNAVDLEADFAFGWLDFAGQVKNAFPGIDFGDTELYNLYAWVVTLKVAGLESETEDVELTQSVACGFFDVFEDGAGGVTADQYGESKAVLTSVLKSRVGDGNYEGLGQTIRNAWERAYASIGAGDATALTQNLKVVGDEDCACPDAVEDLGTDWLFTYYLQIAQDEWDTGSSNYGTYVAGTGFVSDVADRLTVEHNEFTDNVSSVLTFIELTVEGDSGDVGTSSLGLQVIGDTSGTETLITPEIFAPIVEGVHQVTPNIDLNQENFHIRFQMNMDNQSTPGLRVVKIRIGGTGVEPCAEPTPLA